MKSERGPATELVLSLFPGVDLLGRAFAAEGFVVVRGPDLILDERIEEFESPPAGRFDGIIGGPPCQHYSDANRTRNAAEGDRLVLEFLRVIHGARPSWFLMENVRNAPTVVVPGYSVQRLGITDCECGGKQRRLRHIQFGSLQEEVIRPVRTLKAWPVTPAVLCRAASDHDRHSRRLARQSAPPLPLRAFTAAARSRAIGNGVPFLMGRTLARAVLERSKRTEQDCPCGCGRPIATNPNATVATVSCRKRMERKRKGLVRVLSFSNCVHDTNNDGDCQHCWNRGGCIASKPGQVTKEKPNSDNLAWQESAQKAMCDLLDAHQRLDREKLGRALQGIRILVGRASKPGPVTESHENA